MQEATGEGVEFQPKHVKIHEGSHPFDFVSSDRLFDSITIRETFSTSSRYISVSLNSVAMKSSQVYAATPDASTGLSSLS